MFFKNIACHPGFLIRLICHRQMFCILEAFWPSWFSNHKKFSFFLSCHIHTYKNCKTIFCLLSSNTFLLFELVFYIWCHLVKKPGFIGIKNIIIIVIFRISCQKVSVNTSVQLLSSLAVSAQITPKVILCHFLNWSIHPWLHVKSSILNSSGNKFIGFNL